jgi:hypothetical protein
MLADVRALDDRSPHHWVIGDGGCRYLNEGYFISGFVPRTSAFGGGDAFQAMPVVPHGSVLAGIGPDPQATI